MKLYKYTSTGNRLPVQVDLKRVDPSRVLNHKISKNREERNSLCLRGKPCPKYDTRPCCPPRVPLFEEYKSRKYVYLMETVMYLKDYFEVYSKNTGAYFGIGGTHKMTRAINNKVLKQLAQDFGGQAFRVGGCLGCQYHKTGKCNYFMPPLESAGIDLCALSLDVFGREIIWSKPNNPMEYMVALGALYTDAVIPKNKFKEVIRLACNEK